MLDGKEPGIISRKENTSKKSEAIYYYSQVFCGKCGRFITDVGGFTSPQFAASMDAQDRLTPGADLVHHHPELFCYNSRVTREEGPHGLQAAISSVAPVKVDPSNPRIYLKAHLCNHETTQASTSNIRRAQNSPYTGDGGGWEQQKLAGGPPPPRN
ncbi:hypothetical protein F5Y16DRAFT_396749 [Xylariaceae sp. FL0255]|nr:hypothetical protein F5Y16DRAFT_396749 [Xylariaceae sp. FL0255]